MKCFYLSCSQLSVWLLLCCLYTINKTWQGRFIERLWCKVSRNIKQDIFTLISARWFELGWLTPRCFWRPKIQRRGCRVKLSAHACIQACKAASHKHRYLLASAKSHPNNTVFTKTGAQWLLGWSISTINCTVNCIIYQKIATTTTKKAPTAHTV